MEGWLVVWYSLSIVSRIGGVDADELVVDRATLGLIISMPLTSISAEPTFTLP